MRNHINNHILISPFFFRVITIGNVYLNVLCQIIILVLKGCLIFQRFFVSRDSLIYAELNRTDFIFFKVNSAFNLILRNSGLFFDLIIIIIEDAWKPVTMFNSDIRINIIIFTMRRTLNIYYLINRFIKFCAFFKSIFKKFECISTN